MEKNTIVNGVTTEDTTKSGNNVHDSEGKFTFKDNTKSISDNLDKDDDIEFNQDEYNSYNDIDIDTLLFDNNEFENVKDKDIDEILFGEKKEPKNIEEMTTEELLKEIKDCETFLKGEGIDGITKSLFGGDLKLRCSNLRQMKKMIEQYKINLNGCEVSMTKAISYVAQCSSACQYNPFTGSYTFISNLALQFSKLYYPSYEYSKEHNISREKSGFHTMSDEKYKTCYTMTHELGHALHNTMLEDYLGDRAFASTQDLINTEKKFVENFRKDVYNQYILDNEHISYEDFKKKNSNYGIGYGVFEWFAEIFASANCGKPTDVAKSFMKVLKNKGYYKGGL